VGSLASLEIRDIVRVGYGYLVACAEKGSGLPVNRISSYFAACMLLSVLSSMQIQGAAEDWAAKLLEGCSATLTGSGFHSLAAST
jgi:hypothetical protein